jgi:hypothetical protein
MTYLPPPSVQYSTARNAILLAQHDRDTADRQAEVAESNRVAQAAAEEGARQQAGQLATINVAVQGAQGTSAVIKQGQSYQAHRNQDAARVDLSKDFGQVKQGDAGAAKHLQDVKLTEHTSFGERFNVAQQSYLASGARFSDGELKNAGFSPPERKELLALQAKNGGNGVTADQAADFAVKFGAGPKDAAAAQVTRATDELFKQTTATPERHFKASEQHYRRSAAKLGDSSAASVGLRDEMYGSHQSSAENARKLAAVAARGSEAS